MKVAILVAMVLAYISAMNLPVTPPNLKLPPALEQVFQCKSIIAQLEQVAQEIGNLGTTTLKNGRRARTRPSALGQQLAELNAKKKELEALLTSTVGNGFAAFEETFLSSFGDINDSLRMSTLNEINANNLAIDAIKSDKTKKLNHLDAELSPLQTQAEELIAKWKQFPSYLDLYFPMLEKLGFVDAKMVVLNEDVEQVGLKFLELLELIDETEKKLLNATKDVDALKTELAKAKIEFVTIMLENKEMIEQAVGLSKEMDQVLNVLKKEKFDFFKGVLKFKNELRITKNDVTAIDNYMATINDYYQSTYKRVIYGQRMNLERLEEVKAKAKVLSSFVEGFDKWLGQKGITKELISELEAKDVLSSRNSKQNTAIQAVASNPERLSVAPEKFLKAAKVEAPPTIDPKIGATPPSVVQPPPVTTNPAPKDPPTPVIPPTNPLKSENPPVTPPPNTNTDNTTTNGIDAAKQEAWYKNPWAVGGGSAVAVGATVFGVSELAKKNGEEAQSAETTPETFVAE